VTGDYVLEPGALARVERLAEKPKALHNVYLEMLAETGVVGALLLVVVVGACVRAAVVAARSFDAVGRADLALLARGVVVASVAMLSTMVFLSASVDRRMWLLFALGPALSIIATRLARARPLGEPMP
jgi:O-antigen ligase